MLRSTMVSTLLLLFLLLTVLKQIVIGLGTTFQSIANAIIFRGHIAPTPPRADTFFVSTEDGAELHTLVIPPTKKSDKHLLLFYLHGNANCVEPTWRKALEQTLAAFTSHLPDTAVWGATFDYRRYGNSTGPTAPTLANARTDAAAVLRAILTGLPAGTAVLLYGMSLGGYVALGLHDAHPKAIFLEAPFLGTRALKIRFLQLIPEVGECRQDVLFWREQGVRLVSVVSETDDLIDEKAVQSVLGVAAEIFIDKTGGSNHSTVSVTVEWRAAVQYTAQVALQ